MSLFANVGASYEVRPQTGFTSDLMNKLIVSRSRVKEWVQHEKANAEKEAEAYRQQLLQEQEQIDTKSANLLALQLQRGLSLDNDRENDGCTNVESIANQKHGLEEQQKLLESEIEKLKVEFQSRANRVQGMFFIYFGACTWGKASLPSAQLILILCATSCLFVQKSQSRKKDRERDLKTLVYSKQKSKKLRRLLWTILLGEFSTTSLLVWTL